MGVRYETESENRVFSKCVAAVDKSWTRGRHSLGTAIHGGKVRGKGLLRAASWYHRSSFVEDGWDDFSLSALHLHPTNERHRLHVQAQPDDGRYPAVQHWTRVESSERATQSRVPVQAAPKGLARFT